MIEPKHTEKPDKEENTAPQTNLKKIHGDMQALPESAWLAVYASSECVRGNIK
ncbi:MAG: hypothetical protein ACLTSC_00860 [Mediterraneibacter faecis]